MIGMLRFLSPKKHSPFSSTEFRTLLPNEICGRNFQKTLAIFYERTTPPGGSLLILSPSFKSRNCKVFTSGRTSNQTIIFINASEVGDKKDTRAQRTNRRHASEINMTNTFENELIRGIITTELKCDADLEGLFIPLLVTTEA